MARGGDRARSVVDPEALDRLRAFGGSVLLAEIVALFCEAAPERLAAVESAVVSSDPARLRRAAQALRSSADNVGACTVVALAADIETHAETAVRVGGLDRKLRDLRQECEAARVRLRKLAG